MFKIESYTVYNGTSKTYTHKKKVANLEAERAILEAKHGYKVYFNYKFTCKPTRHSTSQPLNLST